MLILNDFIFSASKFMVKFFVSFAFNSSISRYFVKITLPFLDKKLILTYFECISESLLLVSFPFTYPLTKAETKSIKTAEIIYESVEKNSSKIGEIQIYLNTEKIGAIPVYVKAEKKESKNNSLFNKIKQLFS